ncbi:MAG: discoidin domain-containing protein [Muribaculaceae bacterium]|jgi:hypothetical protein|nr:discoidin domain-containing protein [Muribaculaceae bacterium]
MKTKLLFLSLLVCLFTGQAWGVDWTETTNLALNKTAVSSSGTASAGNDGNTGTRWESATKDGEWWFVDLTEAKTISDIEIVWEGAYAKTYQVYGFTTEPTYTTNEDGTKTLTQDLSAATPIYSQDKTLTGFPYTDSHSGLNATARYLLVYCQTRGSVYGNSFYEFRVAERVADYDVVKELGVTNLTINQGESGTVTVSGLNSIGTVIDATEAGATLTASSSDVTITNNNDGTFGVTCNTLGTYTLTASATVAGLACTGTGTLAVKYNWTTNTNIAATTNNSLAVAHASHNDASAYLSNDNNTGTRWEAGGGAVTGTDVYWYVDLGNTYSVNAIEMIWQNAYAKSYKIYTATQLDTEGNPAWGTTEIISQDATLTEFPYEDTHVLATPVTARYIKVSQIENGYPGYGMSMWEFRVAGTASAPSVLTYVNISSNTVTVAGRSENITATATDQYGKAYSTDGITYNFSANTSGASITNGVFTSTQKGSATFTATVGSVTSSPITINTVAEGDNIALASNGATATADASTTASADFAIDGNDGTRWISNSGTEAADQEINHWITVDLGGNYDIDLIEVQWEAAIAKDYEVYASDNADDLGTAVYTKTGNAFGAATHDFYGTTLSGKRYIKINSTKNASAYGNSIYEIKVYGKGIMSLTSAATATAKIYTGTWNAATFAANDAATVTNNDLTSVKGLPSTITVANPNCLVYVASGAACATQNNVVTVSGDNYTAHAIALTAGHPFYAAHDVAVSTADNITFTGSFAKSDEYCPIVLPFSFRTLSSDFEIELLSKVNLAEKKLTFKTKNPSNSSAANYPLMLKLNADFTTITAYNDTVFATPVTPTPGETPAPDLNMLKWIPMTLNGMYSTYSGYTTTGSEYVYDATSKTFVIAASGTLIAPFGAYVYASSNPTVNNLAIEINGTTTNNAVIVDDVNPFVDVYTLDGRLIRHNVETDKATINLEKGFYIVGGKKLFVK